MEARAGQELEVLKEEVQVHGAVHQEGQGHEVQRRGEGHVRLPGQHEERAVVVPEKGGQGWKGEGGLWVEAAGIDE
jgi:hypothetical protein